MAIKIVTLVIPIFKNILKAAMILNGQTLFSIALILIMTACVDRIDFNPGLPETYPVVIDGYISDEPGPYLIKVTKAFDIESKTSIRTEISVKQMTLSDDHGTTETLREYGKGYYFTNDIQGTVGRVYTLKIELLDGRIYETLPDTLLPTGTVDNVYFNYREDKQDNGASQYGFDVFFNSSTGALRNYQFLWKFTGTYKANIPCCTCYVHFNNSQPITSDGLFIEGDQFRSVKAGYVPITGYTFMDKVYAEVSQMSLTRQTFNFWSAVKRQMQATNSLFQPLTGKIPSNFVQLSGPETQMQGLFYATSISRMGIFINRNDIPNVRVIPQIQFAPTTRQRCIDWFPGSTTIKPAFWVD